MSDNITQVNELMALSNKAREYGYNKLAGRLAVGSIYLYYIKELKEDFWLSLHLTDDPKHANFNYITIHSSSNSAVLPVKYVNGSFITMLMSNIIAMGEHKNILPTNVPHDENYEVYNEVSKRISGLHYPQFAGTFTL